MTEIYIVKQMDNSRRKRAGLRATKECLLIMTLVFSASSFFSLLAWQHFSTGPRRIEKSSPEAD
jgi:hypothetical protein